MTYSFQVGKIVFTQGGYRPNKKNVTTFLEGVLPIIEKEGYQAYIIGRVLSNAKNTIDFDMALTGKITDYNKLEQLFYDLYSYGYLTAKIILDLKWLADINVVELDSAGQIQFNDVDYVMIKYFRLITDDIYRVDQVTSKKHTPVTEWLVMRNQKDNPPLAKPHQIEEVKKYGSFLHVPAREFLQDIDKYLT